MLLSTLDSISILDPGKFASKYEGDVLVSLTMKMKTPFLLNVEVNYKKKELKVEFTGKILGEQYPELINLNTISACFNRINALGFCKLDLVKMMNATVMKCDVTKDVSISDVPALNRFVQGHIKNYQSYVCQREHGNLIIHKAVTGNPYKRRLTIYDKHKEMMKKPRQRFMERYGIEDKYDGICRFELNLVGPEAIRKALGVTGATLMEVLRSERNPIEGFLNDSIQEDSEANVRDTWKTYWQTLVLQDCDFDLQKVEAKVREYKGCFRKEFMQPFRELMESIPNGTSIWTKSKLLDAVR